MQQARLAIIGGSKAYELWDKLPGERRGSCVLDTPFGSSARLHFFRWQDVDYVFLSRHGERGYSVSAPYINFRANIWALKEVGVERVVSWSGPGALRREYQPGELIIPDEVLDQTQGRPRTFFARSGLGFIRQWPVFCLDTAQGIAEALEAAGVSFRFGGTYVCTAGPRLETAAEVAALRRLGGDMVGMTLVPEVFLAKELELCYASVVYITNYAEGVRGRRFQPGVLFEGMLLKEEAQAVAEAVCLLAKVLPEALVRLAGKIRACPCKNAMLRYKQRGDIGENWREWI